MKKFITAILAILYLATSSGATITTHYCMGEEVSQGLVKEDKCGKCGMEKTQKGCCEDKEQVIKSPQDSHSVQLPDNNLAAFSAILSANYTTAAPAPLYSILVCARHNNSPPGSSGISLCIFYCVFRI